MIRGVETLPKVDGQSERELIERTVLKILDLRAEGDDRGIVELFAPDFAYVSRGEWAMWPYPARRGDWATFAEALRRLNIDYEFLDSIIHEFLIDGDRAALHQTARMRNRGAGATVDVDMWLSFRFRDGLLVEFGIYVDSSKVAQLE